MRIKYINGWDEGNEVNKEENEGRIWGENGESVRMGGTNDREDIIITLLHASPTDGIGIKSLILVINNSINRYKIIFYLIC